jgi:hypothetical protein
MLFALKDIRLPGCGTRYTQWLRGFEARPKMQYVSGRKYWANQYTGLKKTGDWQSEVFSPHWLRYKQADCSLVSSQRCNARDFYTRF